MKTVTIEHMTYFSKDVYPVQRMTIAGRSDKPNSTINVEEKNAIGGEDWIWWYNVTPKAVRALRRALETRDAELVALGALESEGEEIR